MKAEFHCPSCGSPIRINAAGRGMTIICLECLTSIQVPNEARTVDGDNADINTPNAESYGARRQNESIPQPTRSTPTNDTYEHGMGLIIPYKNGYALAAYYCGIFGLMPCLGIPIALIGFILGWMGLNFRNQHPECRGAAHAWCGIILGGFSLLGHALLIILLPNMQ